MGFFISDESQSATACTPVSHSRLCHSKTAWGPIFIWVLSTKYTDSESGLVYYGFRFYVPESGRWAGRDPIGEAGGESLYGYVGNDPISLLDPFGLKVTVDRNYASQADVYCDCGDTVEDIAKVVKLDADEYKTPGWLDDADGKGLPAAKTEKMKEKRHFKSPNEVHLTLGYMGFGRDNVINSLHVSRITPYYSSKKTRKYKIVDHTVLTAANDDYWLGNSMSTISTALGTKNIAIWAHFGEGNLGDNGAANGQKSGGIVVRRSSAANSLGDLHFAQEFKPHHKLEEVFIYACGSGTQPGEWLGLVAPGGSFLGSAKWQSIDPDSDELTEYPK